MREASRKLENENSKSIGNNYCPQNIRSIVLFSVREKLLWLDAVLLWLDAVLIFGEVFR